MRCLRHFYLEINNTNVGKRKYRKIMKNVEIYSLNNFDENQSAKILLFKIYYLLEIRTKTIII